MQKQEIQEIIDFVQKNYKVPYENMEDLKKAIEGHIKYGTFVVLRDDKGIAAVCRWNIKSTVAHVIDLVIRKDLRGKGLIKYVVTLGWKKFPFLKWVIFEREQKRDNTESKYYPMSRLLGRKS